MSSPDPSAPSTHASLENIEFNEVLPSLLSDVASNCDGDLACRLATNSSDVSASVTTAVSSITATVQHAVESFVYNARSSIKRSDKSLEAKLDEFDQSRKTLLSLLLQSYDGDDTAEHVEDAFHVINHLISNRDAFTLPLRVLAPAELISEALSAVVASSHMVLAIDPALCTATHARWLQRGERSAVVLALFDTAGEPVSRITQTDVVPTWDTEASGWVVESITLESNTVSIGLSLTEECEETATLRVLIALESVVVHLKATASAARVTAAHAACTHLGGLKRALNTEDVATMVAACTPALSSLAVAEDMCLNVHYAADSEFFCVFNRDACCDGGALEAVFAVLSAHSRVLSATMAVTALQALSFLLRDAIRRATALVLSADGLDATVYVVMQRYALDFDVQLNACELMWRLLSGMGPGTALNVIVNGRAAALLAEAKRLHPKLLVGVGSVVLYADKALAMLARRKQELKT